LESADKVALPLLKLTANTVCGGIVQRGDAIVGCVHAGNCRVRSFLRAGATMAMFALRGSSIVGETLSILPTWLSFASVF
jgi:hypothetical protein